ncbi:MAG: GDYXXLXY domain-containing protein, partial [Gemmatimonadetes bacterium]|nr:GDYXXLXY domain-containing protein [Gemmatimonadota bacterium]
MTTRLTRALILAGALLVLVGVNYSIYEKEQVVRTGQTIYVTLAPVDPRSLMQGDYMALRFRLAEDIESWRAADARVRRAPLVVDDRGVAALAPGGGELH